MAVTEMASVALVEDHHNTAILNLLKFAAVPRTGNCGIEFLNGRNNDFGVALKSARKFACVGCTVNRTRLKSIIFRLCLSVEVMTVNNKHYLVNAVKFRYELGGLERIAQEEEIPVEVINRYMSEYDYVQKEQTEIIQEALKDRKLGLVARRRTIKRIVDRLRNIIRTFSWD